MSAGWVAGSVRARALARRRLGAARARELASRRSLDEALAVLATTAYGRDVRPGCDLAAAQHAIAATLLWDLRVLAGWLPRDGVRQLRTLAGWFELANVDELLAAHPGPAFELGSLATAWPRLREAGMAGPGALRAALAGSSWRDPGGDTRHAIRLGMRRRWTEMVAGLGEPSLTWAAGAAALLGQGRLATRGRWVLEGLEVPADLWRGEAVLRARVERDGSALLRTSASDSRVVLGAITVMACDALRVRAALEVAARGGGDLEAYDELA